jgi:hypothetical protein
MASRLVLKKLARSDDMIWPLLGEHSDTRSTAHRRNTRGLRGRQPLERLRMQAGAVFATGHFQAEVGRRLL